MKTIESRIEKLEKKLLSDSDETMVIFVRFVGAENGKPVELPILGWRYDCNGPQVAVMRLESETDEELEERATSLARQNMAKGHYVVRLIHIFE